MECLPDPEARNELARMDHGEGHEARHLSRRFAAAIRNFHRLIKAQRNLAFVTAGYENSITLLPYFLLAGAYFRGAIDFGVFTQASYSFGMVQGALSVFVT